MDLIPLLAALSIVALLVSYIAYGDIFWASGNCEKELKRTKRIWRIQHCEKAMIIWEKYLLVIGFTATFILSALIATIVVFLL